MTDNTNSNAADIVYRRKNKDEMKKHLISFAFMIALTLIAFSLVITEIMPAMLVIPVLFLMAIVQAAFQLYYFMHMKEKGHEILSVLYYGCVWAAILTLAALLTITWW